MKCCLLAVLSVLALTAQARADVSPLPFVFGGFAAIAALFFAIALAWAGIKLAWRSARNYRQVAELPPDDGSSPLL